MQLADEVNRWLQDKTLDHQSFFRDAALTFRNGVPDWTEVDEAMSAIAADVRMSQKYPELDRELKLRVLAIVFGLLRSERRQASYA